MNITMFTTEVSETISALVQKYHPLLADVGDTDSGVIFLYRQPSRRESFAKLHMKPSPLNGCILVCQVGKTKASEFKVRPGFFGADFDAVRDWVNQLDDSSAIIEGILS